MTSFQEAPEAPVVNPFYTATEATILRAAANIIRESQDRIHQVTFDTHGVRPNGAGHFSAGRLNCSAGVAADAVDRFLMQSEVHAKYYPAPEPQSIRV